MLVPLFVPGDREEGVADFAGGAGVALAEAARGCLRCGEVEAEDRRHGYLRLAARVAECYEVEADVEGRAGTIGALSSMQGPSRHVAVGFRLYVCLIVRRIWNSVPEIGWVVGNERVGVGEGTKYALVFYFQ